MLNLLSSPLMRSSYPSSDRSSRLVIFRLFERFLAPVFVLRAGLDLFIIGNGETLIALTVLLLEDGLLSVETCLDCDDRDTVAGRIVLELSSEMFPVDIFGGESFRGEGGFFFSERGGSCGIGGGGGGGGGGGFCGDRNVKPPSKSLSQSSSSVVGGIAWLTI